MPNLLCFRYTHNNKNVKGILTLKKGTHTVKNVSIDGRISMDLTRQDLQLTNAAIIVGESFNLIAMVRDNLSGSEQKLNQTIQFAECMYSINVISAPNYYKKVLPFSFVVSVYYIL